MIFNNYVIRKEKIMILILEILLLVYGIITIITGKFKLNKDKVIKGPRARFLGFLCLLPMPFSLFVSFIYSICLAIQGLETEQIKEKYISHSFYTGFVSFLAFFLLIYFLNRHFYKIQKSKTAKVL